MLQVNLPAEREDKKYVFLAKLSNALSSSGLCTAGAEDCKGEFANSNP
jgi:hypothetical protein